MFLCECSRCRLLVLCTVLLLFINNITLLFALLKRVTHAEFSEIETDRKREKSILTTILLPHNHGAVKFTVQMYYYYLSLVHILFFLGFYVFIIVGICSIHWILSVSSIGCIIHISGFGPFTYLMLNLGTIYLYYSITTNNSSRCRQYLKSAAKSYISKWMYWLRVTTSNACNNTILETYPLRTYIPKSLMYKLLLNASRLKSTKLYNKLDVGIL